MTTDTQALATTLRRLDQLTNWEQRPRGGMRVDLAPMRDLMQRLGNPYKFFQSIHVAGTKGKGSTCSLIEVALLRAGLRVGRYSSPHVENVNERVSLHGQPASDRDLAQSLSCAIDSYEAAKMAGSPGAVATWFDVFTAAAFVLFKEAGLEWAVIEVGIGGRLDSTNVIEGRVAIITNVELGMLTSWAALGRRSRVKRWAS